MNDSKWYCKCEPSYFIANHLYHCECHITPEGAVIKDIGPMIEDNYGGNGDNIMDPKCPTCGKLVEWLDPDEIEESYSGSGVSPSYSKKKIKVNTKDLPLNNPFDVI